MKKFKVEKPFYPQTAEDFLITPETYPIKETLSTGFWIIVPTFHIPIFIFNDEVPGVGKVTIDLQKGN